MPYTTSTVPEYVPASKAKKWSTIWNSAYDYAKGQGKSDDAAEKYAFAVANDKALGEGKNEAFMEREIRIAVGLRAMGGTGDADPLRLEGYAAKFGTWSQDLGGFRETIKEGAFSRALANDQDIRCLMNHDPNFVLGRTKNRTLVLTQDATGLRFSVELPNTQVARDLHTSIGRGDIDQCSFAFKVADNGDKWGTDRDDNGEFISRELQDVDLFDVSAVTYPAYLDTNVSARAQHACAEARSALDKRLAEERAAASLEKTINNVQKVIAAKYGECPPASHCIGPLYWVIETFTDHCIANKYDVDGSTFWSIPITIAEDGTITVGDGMTQMESTWIPTSPRGAALLAERRSTLAQLTNDPDQDGDDDTDVTEAIKEAGDTCFDCYNSAKTANTDLNQGALLDFISKGQAAIAAITLAVAEATGELAEGQNSNVPEGEQRMPDPAATRPHSEGTSMPTPSKKVQLADSDAKLATAHAALKAAKVAHAQAIEALASATDDNKADLTAKAAAAKAAVKTAKAAHMKAAEDHQTLKASFASAGNEKPADGFDPDIAEGDDVECKCRHCRTGLLDQQDGDGSSDDDFNGDCTDETCACQNRWSVSGDDGVMRCLEMDTDGGNSPEEKEAHRKRREENEKRADKVRTKRVGGKDLTVKDFAYVGDPDKTETWKLPIHDKAHVQNALSRFGQTQGIPADKKAGVWRKIKAAAAKFGIEVSKEQNSISVSTFAPDEQERLLMKAQIDATMRS